MKRRTLAAFAALSILVAALAAASVAYRVLDAEAAGRKAALADFERLAAELSAVRSSGDLADEGLRAKLSAHYKRSGSLLLVSVYERGAGLRWRIPARSDYLPASENQEPFPEPSYPERSALLLSAPLKGDITGRLAVDALYSTIDQATVFMAFRDALLALGAYLAAVAVVLALAAAAERGAAGREPSPGLVPGKEESPAGPGSRLPPEEYFEVPELHPEGEEVEGILGPAAGPSPAASASAAEPPSLPLTPPASGLYSPVSGLGWESYLSERLDAELARSASFEQDLSLLVLTYDGGRKGSPAYVAMAKSVMDFFTFRDLAFERGDEGFSVILPNIDIDSALRMAEEFLKKLTFLLRDYRDPLEFLPVFMGLSSRAGRLVDSSRIAQEAAAALQKACDDCDTHIVAFRPDPDKYRLYLAAKGC